MLTLIRDGKLSPNKEMIDALLAGTDKLRWMIENVEASKTDNVESECLKISVFSNLPLEQSTNKKESSTEDDSLSRKLNLAKDEHVYLIELNLLTDLQVRNKTLLEFFTELEALGKFIDIQVDFSKIQTFDLTIPETGVLLKILFATKTEIDLVSLAFDIPQKQVTRLSVQDLNTLFANKATSIGEKASNHLQPLKPKPETSLDQSKIVDQGQKNSEETVRVSVRVLDSLMNLAGELVLGRNRMLNLSARLHALFEEALQFGFVGNDKIGKHKEVIEKIHAEKLLYNSSIQNLSSITTELQEKVMFTRLQPINTVFGKIPRIIRDLSARLKKEVQLKMQGEEVELDKSILEVLTDPLTHLIRNCIDHGIELPEEREKLGKPRIGSVSLSASHVGGNVNIEISDDGRGIDTERIKAKAIEKGLIAENVLNSMNSQQLLNLIFLPGLSTATQVSDISGRGVGMDVVKTNIEKLGGSVTVESGLGKGTSVCIKLPLTLAIVPAILVGAGKNRFAIPQVNVVEIVEINTTNRIEYIYDKRILRLRGQLVPVVHLREFFNQLIKIKSEELTQKIEDEARFLVVVKIEKNQYGIMVDTIYGNEEIVVKFLSRYLKDSLCYNGATITGEGKVAMILDVAGIAEKAKLNFSEQKPLEKITSHVTSKSDAEVQSLLLFRNGTVELFSINLALVYRIEEIKATTIQKIGNKEFIPYQGSLLRLIRIHDFIPVNKPGKDPEILHIIVPKLVTKPIGIISTAIEDIVHISANLDAKSIPTSGILGSTLIRDKVVLFLDIYKIFEIAEPENYQWFKKDFPFSQYRVLLAEDTPFFRMVETLYLKEIFPLLDVAVDGLEAWEALTHKTYDLLITDIEMPGLNGFELTQKVRSSPKLKSMPIIALTALSMEAYKAKGVEVGIDAYELKFDKERLRTTIESVLAKKQKQ